MQVIFVIMLFFCASYTYVVAHAKLYYYFF